MNRFQAWKTAARPHTLPAAIAPVVAAAGLARADGVFRWDAFVWALVAALAIQVAANFANDVSDAARGADTPDRLGPPRMVAEGVIPARQMWVATWAAVAVGALAAVQLLLIAGPVVIVIGVASVVAMLGYVGGPLPYGYRGLGEIFVFLFFGLVATVGARYVHDGNAPLSAWLAAIPIGFVASAILVANNLRDIDTDAAAGKKTLAVILGSDWTRVLYGILMVSAFALVAVFAIADRMPRGAIVAVPFGLMAVRPIRRVLEGVEGRSLVAVLRSTARVHLALGLAIGVGAAIWH
ncbi:MAG TPA: 1,4-dihydroxy-2-naphthoate polyprenyltransferase [Acidimicrobiia bacterium]|nr:1,4-dihydroxy-2-naphthoate polyprenyltransferase [Acidimicrobiia bacterium]